MAALSELSHLQEGRVQVLLHDQVKEGIDDLLALGLGDLADDFDLSTPYSSPVPAFRPTCSRTSSGRSPPPGMSALHSTTSSCSLRRTAGSV